MNVFLLHTDPLTSASYLVDDHVAFVTTIPNRRPIRSCKMALEACQLLSSAHWFGVSPDVRLGPKELWPAPYLPTHAHHPWAVAVRSSLDAYQLVWDHALAILLEHEYRTGGRQMDSILRAHTMLGSPPSTLQRIPWKIPVCRAGVEPVHVSTLEEAVFLYRQYYKSKIERMPRFTLRDVPSWV